MPGPGKRLQASPRAQDGIVSGSAGAGREVTNQRSPSDWLGKGGTPRRPTNRKLEEGSPEGEPVAGIR